MRRYRASAPLPIAVGEPWSNLPASDVVLLRLSVLDDRVLPAANWLSYQYFCGMKIAFRLAAVVCVFAFLPAHAGETPALQFVREYLREFSAIEHIRLAEERELQAPHQSMLSTCVESGNRYRLEITQQMARMRGMSLPPPSQSLPGRLVDLYTRKLQLYTEVSKACSGLKAGANANVSSWEVMSAVSQYSAKVDAIDHLLFETSTQAFSTLLITTPASHSNRSRLGITMVEKQSLLRQIELEFGAELEDDQQTYLVNAATVIRDAIKAHKAADEA